MFSMPKVKKANAQNYGTNKTRKEQNISTGIGFKDNTFNADDSLLGEQE
jgi:hypothetical protein